MIQSWYGNHNFTHCAWIIREAIQTIQTVVFWNWSQNGSRTWFCIIQESIVTLWDILPNNITMISILFSFKNEDDFCPSRKSIFSLPGGVTSSIPASPLEWAFLWTCCAVTQQPPWWGGWLRRACYLPQQPSYLPRTERCTDTRWVGVNTHN